MKQKKGLSYCKRWLNAWSGNQPDKLIEFYDKDCYYQDPANPEGLMGKEDLLLYLRKLLKANPNWKWKVEELYETKKGFVFKWKATIPIRSETLVEYGMDIVEIKEQKITRNEVYFDRSRFQKLLEKT